MTDNFLLFLALILALLFIISLFRTLKDDNYVDGDKPMKKTRGDDNDNMKED